MKALVEFIVGVLRGGKDFERFGDKYEFSGTIIKRGDHIEIIGLSGNLSEGAKEAINELLCGIGAETVEWERYKGNGVIKRIVVKVKRPSDKPVDSSGENDISYLSSRVSNDDGPADRS